MSSVSTVDILLEHLAGACGRAQMQLMAWASLSYSCTALQMLVMVFASSVLVSQKLWTCTNVIDQECVQVLQSSEVSIPDFCSLRPEQWSWTYPEQSIVAEYNLVCDSAWKVGLVNSFYFVGMAVGGPLLGALTDHYGRKKALYICTALGAVSCALSAAGSSYWLYFLWRFVNGMAVQGMSTADQVLMMEVVGADYRGRVGTITQAHYAGGSCLLAVLAYTFPSWRSVVLACATVTALFLLTWWFVEESPRWLENQGQHDKAMAVLQRFAQKNGRGFPDIGLPALTAFKRTEHSKFKHDLDDNTNALSPHQRDRGDKSVGKWQALKNGKLRACFLSMSFALLAMVLSYYGASFGLESFPGNQYFNFMLLSLADLPSAVAVTVLIDRVGRVPIIWAGLMGTGVACILCGFITGSLQILLAIIGKLGSDASWNTLVTYSSEVLPTSVRAVLSGSVGIIGRIGGVLAPFIFVWAKSWGMPRMPFLLMGSISLISTVMCIWLPETCGSPPPDTMLQYEQLAEEGNLLTRFVQKVWNKVIGDPTVQSRQLYSKTACADDDVDEGGHTDNMHAEIKALDSQVEMRLTTAASNNAQQLSEDLEECGAVLEGRPLLIK